MNLIGLYLRDTVTRVRPTGTDEWGETLDVTESAHAARVEYRSRWVPAEGGEWAQSSARLLLAPGTSVAHTDRWKLIGDPREYATLRIGHRAAWSEEYVEVDLG
jgi:hypothetical protein